MRHPWSRASLHRPTGLAAAVGAAVAIVLPELSLAAASGDESLGSIVVTATRTHALLGDEPLHVEAVPAEEIEENLTVRPGDVTSLLAELPGLRFESNAPALGGAGLRVRGLPARHTLVLLDGLPSLGADAGAFGLLQVLPLDLARVEVLKGPTSALYGAGGLGGLLNLVSKPPGADSGYLLGVNSRGARDAVAFLAGPAGPGWHATVTGGANAQSRQDVDGDGWADLPEYRRYTIRPRAWFDGATATVFATVGASAETRDGGTMPGRVLPAGTAFAEHLRTERYDAGVTGRWNLGDGRALTGRYSVTRTDAWRRFGTSTARSSVTTGLVEQVLQSDAGTHRWQAGVAADWNRLDADPVPGLSHSELTPAAFVQDVWTPVRALTVGSYLRVDASARHGTFVSPRLSVLVRASGDWTLRLSASGGFALPTPFLDAVESTWLGALAPVRDLHAERSRSAAVDVQWTHGGLQASASAFATEVRGLLDVRTLADGRLDIYNRSDRWRAPGIEFLAGYVAAPLHVIASWSAIDATVGGAGTARAPADRVPRSAASVGIILEDERRGRIGVEAEYTGPQAVDADPWRTRAPGYVQVNALAEWRLGDAAVYVNALNLTDARQTRWDPLLRPRPGPGGDPITGAWGPLDGRTFGIGVRGEF